MNRVPPIAVRRQLAGEVGFGCPVKGCGSPYLSWHHFDPPWATSEHHDPEGMVALCRDHHPEADAGAFTIEQLREMKRLGRDRSHALGARFNWMRDTLLAVVGGNFYYETPIALRVGDVPVVWFNRDQSGRLLVNLRMPTTSQQPRMLMIDNFWISGGADEREIVCPPGGRLVHAKYPNGDQLRIEFREVTSVEQFDRQYPRATVPAELKRTLAQRGVALSELPRSHADSIRRCEIEFPLAVVEIAMEVAGTDLSFGPKMTSIGGSTLQGCWTRRCAVGVQIGNHRPT